MTDLRLTISDENIKRIKQHGEKTYPEECCGFLYGKEGNYRHILEIAPIENEQTENRARRFLISPEQFTAAEIPAPEQSVERFLLSFQKFR